MHPSSLSIHDFSYILPEENIAKFPLPERDQSRLLVYKEKKIIEGHYGELANFLPSSSLLVFNNTKVIEARIFFQKPTGGMIEIFALEPDERYADISTAMKQTRQVYWKCLIGGASKWKHGQVLKKVVRTDGGQLELTATIADRLPGSFIILFEWKPVGISFAELLEIAGIIPVPPYLKRETDETDKERYQTIFAKEKGSVAAPTAALHFTEKVMASLKAKMIDAAFLTLHVGAGTFMPVKSELMQDHNMHSEYIEVTISFLNRLLQNEGQVFPVGTTSMRAMESMYWMGVKCSLDPDIDYEALAIRQWEVYEKLRNQGITRNKALEALTAWMRRRGMEQLVIRTSILIAPGYDFKVSSGLITNFHQPQSTLLLLVAALIGDDWKKLYDYALAKNFRFLSYGDGCLLFPL